MSFKEVEVITKSDRMQLKIKWKGQILSLTDKRNTKLGTQQVSSQGWGCGSGVECLLSMSETLGSLLSTIKITIEMYVCVVYICIYIMYTHISMINTCMVLPNT